MINTDTHAELISLLKQVLANKHPCSEKIARFGISEIGKFWAKLGDEDAANK